jgi:hypothetical protein
MIESVSFNLFRFAIRNGEEVYNVNDYPYHEYSGKYYVEKAQLVKEHPMTIMRTMFFRCDTEDEVIHLMRCGDDPVTFAKMYNRKENLEAL